jgi:hypothetical protein
MVRFTGTTQFYKSLADLALVLGASGPVLIISPTRPDAMRVAGAIADRTPELGDSPLAAYAALRLGGAHPLVRDLHHGVAYHHASLPEDVLAYIEDQVVGGAIRYISATTTLTEGVNLPVRTVLVAAQGTYATGGEYEEFITGPRLLNAIGRAGRAAIETEGWVVLARQNTYAVDDFERLVVGDEDLEAQSALATAEALTQLQATEAALRDSVDMLFSDHGGVVNSFLAFVWTLAALVETRYNTIDRDRIQGVVRSSLAWRQSDIGARRRLTSVADLAVDGYAASDPAQRVRFGRGGTSLAGARVLDEIVRRLRARPLPTDEGDHELLFAILSEDVLDLVRTAPEAPTLDFRPYRSAPIATRMNIEEPILLREWITGVEIDVIGRNVLARIADEEYRLELLGDYMAEFLEGYLPWVTGIIIDWYNAGLGAEETRLPRRLAGYIRYGVGNPAALQLARRGVRSRSLAHRVADAYQASGTTIPLKQWLGGLSLREWSQTLCRGPVEFKELVEFARPPASGLLSRILEREEVVRQVRVRQGVGPATEVRLGTRRLRGIEQPILFAGRKVAADFAPADVGDVLSLLATSIPLASQIRVTDDRTDLVLRLAR